jgi:hypothetical protein
MEGTAQGDTPTKPAARANADALGVGADREIPPQLERSFEPFTQAEDGANPDTRPTGGTGLGVAVSRRLARFMGGDLTVESRPGAGAAFTLWLPAPEDLAATFVTDVGLAVRTLGASGPEPAALLCDGTAILAFVAERHGAKRARLGWPPESARPAPSALR